MADECRELILQRVRERGRVTFAEFMDLALYHPECGYYARAPVRSGRAGDFFTSVDLGPLFGELLGVQLAEMWRILSRQSPVDNRQSPADNRQSPVDSRQSTVSQQSPVDSQQSRSTGDSRPLGATLAPGARHLAPGSDYETLGAAPAPSAQRRAPSFDLVEAGAGSGRLARDILDHAARRDPELYLAIRLHLVERSPAARAQQERVLGPHANKLAGAGADVPDGVEGVIFANELLDALPAHVVVMRDDGLREVFVEADGSRLVERADVPSTPEIAEYFARSGARLQPGWRAEVNLAAEGWIRDAARRLRRGFLLLIDYGHPSAELYSATHRAGTLTAFYRHTAETGPAQAGASAWLTRPGECDITSHVDLTMVQRTAEQEGLETLCVVDQGYFLASLGVAAGLDSEGSGRGSGVCTTEPPPNPVAMLRRRLALKTMMLPGGMGSTHKALLFARGVGRPALIGCPRGARLT